MDSGSFFSSIKIEDRNKHLTWEVVNVYGPVQIERKSDFLLELTQKIESMD